MSITSADDKEVEIVEEKKLYPTRLRKREEEKAKCLAQGLKYEEPKKKVIYEPQDWARSIKKSLKYDKKKTKRIRNPSPSESEPESESDSEVELIEISDKEEGDWTRKAPKSKFMRIKSIKKVGTSNNKIEKPKSSPPKPKPPKDDEELKCQCGLVIKGHNNLHQHLVLEHPPPTIHHCTKCNQNTKGLRNNFLCRICSKFVLHMKEHMKEHYRDRATDKCMYECRLCYKIFKTVDEVMDHERRLHGTLGAKQVHQQPTGPAHIYMCEYCHEKFPKKRERDVHAGSHYEPILPLMWDKIITLHEGLCNCEFLKSCTMIKG
ncbi:hypothetical protein WR25_20272 isoform B [Diploscapter pachys]|uniref:C2H2-type domain-containing protein n=1 Tax=Diploscapter pachys TaxID=2018661 RepID=A0A2A2LP68_9BILA|nr:hypothetical protein WR25_20272 isoform B [Diploscapter pachys]